jgi:chemotaxis protein MotB
MRSTLRPKSVLSISRLPAFAFALALAFALAFIGGLSGCVSSGTHRDLETRYQTLQAQYAELEEKNHTVEQTVSEQTLWIPELENKMGEFRSDKEKLQSSLTETQKALEQSAQRKLETEQRIREYTDLVEKFKSLMDAGRLTVKIVDGRMVVALSSDILFSSGSSALSRDGRAAIREVGQLLATIPDRKFQVEGHTDNLPIQNAQFPSNWYLASARALTVVNELIEAGMSPARISAASFGEHKPAQTNDTKEGRKANRRIEIVIVPDLSSLPGFEELRRLSSEVPVETPATAPVEAPAAAPAGQ